MESGTCASLRRTGRGGFKRGLGLWLSTSGVARAGLDRPRCMLFLGSMFACWTACAVALWGVEPPPAQPGEDEQKVAEGKLQQAGQDRPEVPPQNARRRPRRMPMIFAQPPALRGMQRGVRGGGGRIRGFAQLGHQVELAGATEGDEFPLENVFAPPERAVLQRFEKAQDLIEAERFAEALRLLGNVLDAPEDAFFQPDKNQPVFRSIKSEVQRLIGRLPEQGRQSYELQFGADARRLLTEAADEGNTAKLAEVSRRFFHTEAGYEATYLMGMLQMDRGQPLAAALCFRRLKDSARAARRFEPSLSFKLASCWLEAGAEPQARETLAELVRRFPDESVKVAGRQLRLLEARGDELAWLLEALGSQPDAAARVGPEWLMARGDPARNAASDGGSPLLNRRWAVPTTTEPYVEQTLDQLRQAQHDQGLPMLPAAQPLAVAGHVFMRSVSGLEVVDFRTGKRIWHGPVDDVVRQMLEADGQYSQVRGTPQSGAWLRLRMWEDLTYGGLASDGKAVFCIEDLNLGAGTYAFGQPQIVRNNGRVIAQNAVPPSSNRLAAYDIATEGKLKWDLGGASESPGAPLAGAYFLGPPLPLGGRLYALVEQKSEVRLVALAAETGEVEWSQQLAVLEFGLPEDFSRRTCGISPTYADGVLVCPTAAGAVVGIDLTTRALRWGYQYRSANGVFGVENAFQLQGNLGAMMMTGELPTQDRWADPQPVASAGKVVLTPRESNELHCLDLATGDLLWKVPRGDGVHVGAVQDEIVLVVGRTSLTGLRLDTGKPAWPHELTTLPSGAAPSGRGFSTGDRYFLPLSSAEVASIEIATGRILSRSRSRIGAVPGNLICYRGAVISQGVDYVESFYQLDELRKQVAEVLAQQPDDPLALARQGELFLDEGKLDAALESLTKSHRAAENEHTRDLLVDAMIEALRSDFAKHRGLAADVEQLTDEATVRSALARVVAAGQDAAGEVLPAFESYLRILESGPPREPLAKVEPELSVRREPWVAARLARLLNEATPATNQPLAAIVQARYDAAKSQTGPQPLRDFLELFPEHSLAIDGRRELLARLSASEGTLERVQLLRLQAASPDSSIRHAAIAELAENLVAASRASDAAVYVEQLMGELASVPCREGRLGRDIAAELVAKSTIGDSLAGRDVWPTGRVEVTKANENPAVVPNTVIEPVGRRAPVLSRQTMEWDYQVGALFGRDGQGREQWRLSLRDRSGAMQYGGMASEMTRLRADGHLFVVALSTQVVGIDTLGQPGRESARILWSHDLTDGLPNMVRPMAMPGGMAPAFGRRRFVIADSFGNPLGALGPVTSRIACFQRGRNLLAVHPRTGETLWIRNDTQPGSVIFGGDRRIYVVPPSAEGAVVVRATDGELLGQRDLPADGERLISEEDRILLWRLRDGSFELTWQDIWDGRAVWTRTFDESAKVCTVHDESVAVLDGNGHLVLLSVTDGSVELEAQLEGDQPASEIHVVRTPRRDLVIANRARQNPINDGVMPVPASSSAVFANGFVHGFDRATRTRLYSTEILGQYLVLDQPVDLPLLVFASNHASPRRRNNTRQFATVQCLDTRSGRIVFNEKDPNMITTVDVQSDVKSKTIVLRMQRSAAKLTFTNEPWPEETASDDAAKGGNRGSLAERTGRALLRGLGNWVRSYAEEEGLDDDDAQPDDAELELDLEEIQDAANE